GGDRAVRGAPGGVTARELRDEGARGDGRLAPGARVPAADRPDAVPSARRALRRTGGDRGAVAKGARPQEGAAAPATDPRDHARPRRRVEARAPGGPRRLRVRQVAERADVRVRTGADGPRVGR